MPSGALPANVKVVAGYGQWAGPDKTDPHNELDVWMLGDDGHLYHKWFAFDTGWHGPEVVDQMVTP